MFDSALAYKKESHKKGLRVPKLGWYGRDNSPEHKKSPGCGALVRF